MMNSSQQAFLNFLSLWASTHSRPVTCATLLPLAEACGVDLGRAVALRARRSNLGRLLCSAGAAGGWKIVAGKRTDYGVLYSLESCQTVPKKTAGVETG